MRINERASSPLVILLVAFPSGVLLLSSDEKPVGFTGMEISFKLDPRLSSGVYGGERWVSPPKYAGASAQDTVEAKAYAIGADGRRIRISPEWIATDPEMVVVSPSKGEAVSIEVRRAGESKLKVTSQEISKELAIRAVLRNNSMQIEIEQLGGAGVIAPKRQDAPPADSKAAPALKSQEDKLSYAIGANLGFGVKRQLTDVNSALVIQGLTDALSGSYPLMTEHEVQVMMAGLKKELNNKQITSTAEKIVAAKTLAEKNKTEGEAFLAQNKTKEGVVTLESGLQYKILKAGAGKKPSADDMVICNYRGSLIDGTEFDSSYKRNEPTTFAVRRVIKGWAEAVQSMPVGSKWQLFIPSHLAYGVRGSRGVIGPNATLIFEVELLTIKEAMPSALARNAEKPSTGTDSANHPKTSVGQGR